MSGKTRELKGIRQTMKQRKSAGSKNLNETNGRTSKKKASGGLVLGKKMLRLRKWWDIKKTDPKLQQEVVVRLVRNARIEAHAVDQAHIRKRKPIQRKKQPVLQSFEDRPAARTLRSTLDKVDESVVKKEEKTVSIPPVKKRKVSRPVPVAELPKPKHSPAPPPALAKSRRSTKRNIKKSSEQPKARMSAKYTISKQQFYTSLIRPIQINLESSRAVEEKLQALLEKTLSDKSQGGVASWGISQRRTTEDELEDFMENEATNQDTTTSIIEIVSISSGVAMDSDHSFDSNANNVLNDDSSTLDVGLEIEVETGRSNSEIEDEDATRSESSVVEREDEILKRNHHVSSSSKFLFDGGEDGDDDDYNVDDTSGSVVSKTSNTPSPEKVPNINWGNQIRAALSAAETKRKLTNS